MVRSSFLCLVLTVAAVPAMAQAPNGAALYTQRCQSCHEGGAAARAPGRDVISALAADRIVGSLETGTMREQGAGLTPDERRAVATYLSTAPAAAPAVARSCEAVPAFVKTAPSDWQAWGVSPDNDRFQRQGGIAASDVPNLKLRWAFAFDGETAATGNPTIADDWIFVGSPSGRVFALALKDGCQRWMFKADAGVRSSMALGTDRGGVAYAIFGDLSATMYAVNAATGALRWKRKLDDHRAARITGSPVIYNGRVYVGISSTEEASAAQPTYACCTFRGSVVALDATTGERIWQTYMIPETPAPRGTNKSGTQLWGAAGAGVWSAPTIDPLTGSLYVATGDGYTAPAAPLTDAIVALDLQTGAVKWANQVTAGDAWTMACGSNNTTNCPDGAGPDHDFGQPPILVSFGGGRRMLVAGQKSGIVHAFNPDDRGRKLWTREVGKGGMLGGLEWGSASDGVNMYLPLSDIAFKDPVALGRGGLKPDAGGGLFAVRLSDGAEVWSAKVNGCGVKPSCSPALSAPAALIAGAVFAGSIDGHFRAYSTTDGKVLWDFDTAREFTTVNGVRGQGGSIDIGGPAIANGVVATTSGYAQWGGMRGNVLLVFSVNGQ